jgi:hypothetical protein
MPEPLINLLAVIVGALASSVPQELFRGRQEVREGNKAALEYERKQYEELLPMLAKFAFKARIMSVEITHKEVIDMLRFMYSFNPYSEFAQDMDEFINISVDLSNEKWSEAPGDDQGAKRLRVNVLAEKIAGRSKKSVYPVKPVKGLSVAALDRQWQQIRSKLPWNLERSRGK